MSAITTNKTELDTWVRSLCSSQAFIEVLNPPYLLGTNEEITALEGGCVMTAIALKEALSRGVVQLLFWGEADVECTCIWNCVNQDTQFIHATVQLENGNYLDGNGLSTYGELLSYWGLDELNAHMIPLKHPNEVEVLGHAGGYIEWRLMDSLLEFFKGSMPPDILLKDY